jgi:hypothetical protein
MNLHPTRPDDRIEAPRISPEQLLHLGMQRLVYLRSAVVDGARVFVIHGADGRPVVAVDTVMAALEAAAERGLDFVPVH